MRPLRFSALALVVGLACSCAVQRPAGEDPSEPDTDAVEPPTTGAASAKRCEPSPVGPASEPAGNGWGLDPENTRFQTADRAALPRTLVPELSVDWSLRPRTANRDAQPAAIGDTLIVGSADGVAAVDANNACTRWSGRYSGNVTTGFANAGWGSPQPLLFFGDDRGRVLAVDGLTGALRWAVQLDGRTNSRISGTPSYSNGVLYTSFRVAAESEMEAGGIVALDAETGALLWKSDGRGSDDETELAFLGGPTIDTERGLLYASSGPSESAPRGAVLALDIATGQVRWRFDAESTLQAPSFRSAPVLVRVEEGDVLIAAHESGVAYGIDPTSGDWVWERRLGSRIGVGLAALGDTIVVPTTTPAESHPGLFALDAFTGETRWQYRSQSSLLAPPTAFPAGIAALYDNGAFRVHDSDDGALVFDARIAVAKVGKRQTAGPVVAGGRIVLVTPDGAVVALAP